MTILNYVGESHSLISSNWLGRNTEDSPRPRLQLRLHLSIPLRMVLSLHSFRFYFRLYTLVYSISDLTRFFVISSSDPNVKGGLWLTRVSQIDDHASIDFAGFIYVRAKEF